MQRVQLQVFEYGYDRTVHVDGGYHTWLGFTLSADGVDVFTGDAVCIVADPLVLETERVDLPQGLPQWTDVDQLLRVLVRYRAEAVKAMPQAGAHKLPDREAFPFTRRVNFRINDAGKWEAT